MMSFRILSWTGKVEEHFPRHVQGLELRKNSWRTPETLIEGPMEAEEPQKRHMQGSDGKTGKKGGWSASGELGGGSASPKSGSRAGRKNARGRRVDGFLVPVLWDKLEISSRRSLRCRKKSSPESSPEKFPTVNVF